ncbi:protein of unknown function [Halomicrobium zhouii]|uniref:DUF4382 domain-containing protein n=1 Tax=Halomicrobium zhouii TaxID=767519 RepID=A0A1I6L3N4_9EURY|nr:DUF4382 domain-containing protein [Halomicrobium zhouii]SFR97870.1 protein of unknown function [Halomicrobium zhouii]
MRVTTLRTVAVVAVVVLAGCSGVVSQGDQATPTAPSSADASTANQGYSVSVVSQTSGSDDGVDFYVSDEENAIDDFAHLNVTITRVGFQRASDGDNESDGGWVERDVDNRSVDLTRLKGANATRLTTVDAPNGSYDTVFAYVSDVNGTLTDGEQVRVKLPSEKLQIHKPFTVGDGESVDFVFDIAVHKAGNSGKYVLKPVVGESGTDVPMTSVDEDDDDERDGVLDVNFVGNVTRGGNATLEVTRNGSAVENATVTVDDEQAGTTDGDGRLTVAIPDADEVEITVEAGDAETELELDFEREADAEEDEESDETEEAEDTEETEETEDDEAEGEAGDDDETEETAEEDESEETAEDDDDGVDDDSDDEDSDDDGDDDATETTASGDS